jgi:hypothetical protein
MSDPREEHEHAMQLAAERETGSAVEPGVRRYRRLYQALHEVDGPEVPLDFAIELERTVRSPTRRDVGERIEQCAIYAGGIGLSTLFIAACMAVFGMGRAHGSPALLQVPWPLLIACAAGLLLLGWVDRRQAGPSPLSASRG